MKTQKRIEWNLETAAAEFDINPRTLSKRLKQLGIEPAFNSGGFSTAQMCQAVFGDYQGQRLRKLTAEAAEAELDLAARKGEVLPTDSVLRVWSNIAIAIRQVIKGSNLSDTEKNECLRQLRELQAKDFMTDVES